MNNGALHFNTLLTTKDFEAGIRRIESQIRGVSKTTEQETSKMDNAFKKLSIGIGTYFSANALQGFVRELINVRGEFQKTEIAFSTMLQSKEKAKELMSQMVDLAAKTPFGLQDVTDGAKRLLAFQVPANEVVEILRRIGDVAAGLGVPLGQLIHVYGQVKAQGKLMTNDLYQFMNAGIPILAELSKVMGKSEAEIKKMVGEGKIGFTEIQQVIQNMTNEGGLFFNLMEEQSKSLSGKVANLGDAWEQMLNKIGESNEGLLADGIEGLTHLVEHYEDVLEVLTGLVISYGAYKTAIITTSIIEKTAVVSSGNLTLAKKLQAIATNIATTAQTRFNAVLSANPYGIAAALLAGLVYTIYKFSSSVETAIELQEDLNKALLESTQSVEDKKAKIDALVSAIKDENKSNQERLSLINQLNKLTNDKLGKLDLEMVKTGELDSKVKNLINTLYKQAEAMAYVNQLGEAYKKEKQLDAEIDDVIKNGRGFFSSIGDFFDKDAWKGTNNEARAYLKTLGYTTDQINKMSGATINRLANEKKAIKEHIDFIKKKAEETSKYREEETTSTTPPDLGGDEKKKGSKKELAEVYSKDSIKDLEQRISLWNNALDRAYKNEKGELVAKKRTIDKYGKESDTKEVVAVSEIKKHLQELESKKRELQKQLAIQTYREELEEAERHWNNYYKIAQHYGEESAKTQYSELLKGHQSYLSYLEAEAEALENRQILSEEDRENLVFLQEKIQNLSGAKTPLENWKTELDDNLRGVKLISEQIDIIENKVDEIFQKEGNTINFLQFRKDANQQIEQLKSQLKDQYNAFLEEHRTYEEKRTALTREYAELRALAESEAERKKIDKAEKEALGDLDADMIKQSVEWQVAFGEMEGMTNTSLQRILQRLLEFKEKSKGTLSIQDSAELEKAIQRVQNAANRNPFKGFANNFKEYFTSMTRSKKAQDEYNKAVDKFGANSDEAKEATERMIEADKKALEAKQKLITLLNDSQASFNAIGQGVMDIADAFGGLDDASKDAIEDIMAIGNAAFDLGKSIVSGNIAGMIKSGVQLLGSVFKALSGDKKKERAIKRQEEALNKLKMAYDDLAHSAKKAIGAQKYNGQRDMIRNLEAQNAQLQQMINTERDKKRADDGKIQEYEKQIKENQRAIQDMQMSIIEDILQTDLASAASKVGDALVDAFSRGENSVKSLKEAANDMIKSLLKNQLNLKLQEKMKPLMDKLLKDAGFDGNGNGSFKGLTQQQIEDFKQGVANAGLQMQSFLDATKDIWQEDFGVSDSLKGALKGMSEERAGALEGQFNAVRINTGEILKKFDFGLEMVKKNLSIMAQIEINTRVLHNILKEITLLNGKVKKDGSIIRAIGI
ncbi:tape measure protein [Bergeyella zoohelcum]|uniref:tape measure protein n=1 Tax=Bergeyella zoohelcum TaxID=1015 RepID=UPI003737103E